MLFMSNIIQFDSSVIYFNKMRIVNYCIYIVTFVNIPMFNRSRQCEFHIVTFHCQFVNNMSLCIGTLSVNGIAASC